MLEKNPEDRYQSAREVLVDLRRLKRALDTGKLESPRPGVFASPRPLHASNQWPVFSAVLLVVFALGILVGQAFLRVRRPKAATMRFSAVTNFAGVESQPRK